MFGNWQIEKAKTALIDEAQALSDRLEGAKPHHVESLAAAVVVCAVRFGQDGTDLYHLADWPAAERSRFIRQSQTRVTALRKARDYAASDGLAVWLMTARALDEPRMMPAVRGIWTALMGAGVNTEAMIADQVQDAGLPEAPPRQRPKGISSDS